MQNNWYLFIDGAYLREHYSQSVRKWFGDGGEIDFQTLKKNLGVQKCFYYDCLDDIKHDSETESEFNSRLAQQESVFNKIREVDGTHVRLGSLTGSKKNKRQKEVDILLAVDMMNHAVRQNMSRAFLLSGDRDFKPLVESLVQMGLFVIVVADIQHTSNELAWAADKYIKVTLREYHAWSTLKLQNKFPIPQIAVGNPDVSRYTLLKAGYLGDISTELYKTNSEFLMLYKRPDSFLNASFADAERLTLFFELQLGGIIWNT